MFQYEPYDNRASIGDIIRLMMAGPQARAQAARASGEARAHAMEIAGQNSAQLGMTLGNIASGTAQQIAHQYSPEAKALQDQRQALAEERKYNLSERQRLTQQRGAVDSLMRESIITDPTTGIVTYDRPTLMSGMTKLNLAPDEQEKWLKLLDSSDAAVKTAKEAQNGALKQIAGIVDATGNDSSVFENEVKRAIANGIISERMAAPYLDAARRDPSHIAKVTSAILGKKPDLITAKPGDVVFDKNAPPGSPPVFEAPPKPDVKHYEQKSVLLNGKEAVVSYDPSSGKSFDAQGTDVSANVKPMPPAATRVQVNAGPQEGALSPEGLDYAATQYRLTGVMPALGMGKNADRGKIVNTAAQQAKALGQSPAAAIQKQAARKADSASLTQITKMKGAAESFETKALAQADKVVELSNAVGRTRWPIVNAALLAGKTEIAGDTQATQLLNAVGTFTAEYAKIVEGSTGSAAGSSDSARRMTERLLNPNMNKGTVADVVKLMKWEMSQTIQGYDATIDHITTRMGGSTLAPAPTDTSVPVKPPQGGGITYQDYLNAKKKPGGG
jgi:hypothetical protein